ncbi:N-acetyl sugar amidotransferase, partial [Flavobacteriaceae bacterium]|nr:N-acetyl sugar amidotransferase [Flavobacteriaceae bacterium]
ILKKMGLNPIAIHFDNGWNSELATKNIELTLDKLNIDLYTYVIDWDYFKEIQKAFLFSSTPDGEVPTDHAINALLFNEANKRNIKYIINGMNFITEGAKVNKWAYGHSDWKYIKSVTKKFSKIKSFKKYPHFSILSLLKNVLFNRLKVVSILNYIDYNKDEAMKTITDEIGWKYYGGKHYESIYTRFFQGYFLPLKFGIDKRRAHLSDLIRSGQEKRENALKIMKLDTYPDLKLKEEDLEFVKKKLDLSDKDFAKIIKMKNKSFENYPNNERKISKLKNGLNWLRKNKYYTK